MDAKIGYPDYLDDSNTTKLEKDYAEVRHNNVYFYYPAFISCYSV